MQRMSWRSFVAAQADLRRPKTKRAARAAPSSVTGSQGTSTSDSICSTLTTESAHRRAVGGAEAATLCCQNGR
jgi:hypothetical protein